MRMDFVAHGCPWPLPSCSLELLLEDRVPPAVLACLGAELLVAALDLAVEDGLIAGDTWAFVKKADRRMHRVAISAGQPMSGLHQRRWTRPRVPIGVLARDPISVF